jgi:polyhydroxyalkanoate synthesis regulator phasin
MDDILKKELIKSLNEKFPNDNSEVKKIIELLEDYEGQRISNISDDIKKLYERIRDLKNESDN